MMRRASKLQAFFSLLILCILCRPVLAADLEQTELTFGFIKLTDMAPLAVAVELGYFEEEGLDVTLIAEPDWQVLLDDVLSGKIHGAHMLPGQALATAVAGVEGESIVTPFSMDLNGNAITVSNDIWEQMKPGIPVGADTKPIHPISAFSLKPVVDSFRTQDKPFRMGMVSPTSTHNYELRYWLAAGGIHPGYYDGFDSEGQDEAQALLSVTPPPLMPGTLASGELEGFCVGEPWNQQAVADRVGVAVITDFEIWNNNPEKIFGLKEQFVNENPNTTLAIVRALIRATYWLDFNDDVNRGAVVSMISKDEYIGASAAVIGASMTGTFEYEPGDVRFVYDFNVFYRYFANYPFYSDAVWTLTQMRRWGQITENKDDSWYEDIARSVYKPDIYLKAAQQLVNSGAVSGSDFPWNSDGFKPPTDNFIDAVPFDGKKPNDYLQSLVIGLK